MSTGARAVLRTNEGSGRSWLLVTAMALGCGCSSSSATTRAEHGDWTSSAARSVEPADAGANGPDSERANASTPAVDAAPRPDALVYPPGWYCTEVRRRMQDADYVSWCSKAASACEKVRDAAWERGQHTSECSHQETAFCFLVESKLERFEHLNCTASMSKCQEQRARSVQLEDPATTTQTECQVYE